MYVNNFSGASVPRRLTAVHHERVLNQSSCVCINRIQSEMLPISVRLWDAVWFQDTPAVPAGLWYPTCQLHPGLKNARGQWEVRNYFHFQSPSLEKWSTECFIKKLGPSTLFCMGSLHWLQTRNILLKLLNREGMEQPAAGRLQRWALVLAAYYHYIRWLINTEMLTHAPECHCRLTGLHHQISLARFPLVGKYYCCKRGCSKLTQF